MTTSRAASSRSSRRWAALAATTIACIVAASVSPPSAAAPSEVHPLLVAAFTASNKNDFVRAAEICGEAAALAHSMDDLAAEQECAVAIDAILRQTAAPDAAGKTPEGRRPELVGEMLAALLAKLDASRRGAFLSAPVLAREILYEATETGKTAHVAAAAKVLAAEKTKSGAGAAAAVVHGYAQGFADLAAGSLEKAAERFDDAKVAALNAHWLDLASHAGTEAAAAWLSLQQPVRARASLADVGVAYVAEPKLAGRARNWAVFAKTRLASAPEGVLDPLATHLEGRLRETVSGGKGGAGGKPGRSRSEPVESLKTSPRTTRMALVKRLAATWVVRWFSRPDEPDTVRPDATVQVVDVEGIAIGFFDRSVSLAMIDFEGGRGVPGGRSEPSRAAAFYLLDEGETWSVTKAGHVTITRGK